MYMDRTLYKNIVYGILSWYKFIGRKSVYRTEVSDAFRVQGAVTAGHYETIIGSDLSDMMAEFASEFGGKLVKEFTDPTNPESSVVKGSVRIEF
jgi:hypothetical protein